jgi:hypothetical protein
MRAMKFIPLCLLLVILLAGCAPAAEFSEPDGSPTVPAVVQPAETTSLPVVVTATEVVGETSTPATTTTATETKPTATTAATPTASPTLAPTPAVTFGRTDEGAFFHGAPDAPVTLIDYSDFL